MLEIVIAFKPLLAFLNASKGLVWLTEITQGGGKIQYFHGFTYDEERVVVK